MEDQVLVKTLKKTETKQVCKLYQVGSNLSLTFFVTKFFCIKPLTKSKNNDLTSFLLLKNIACFDGFVRIGFSAYVTFVMAWFENGLSEYAW